MESFRELREKHQRTAVKLDHDEIAATGVLSLSGQKTSVLLSGENLLALSDLMRKGLDLPLTMSDGGRIFLHNALTTSLRMPTQNSPDYECDIFPNFIAFGADSLTKDGRLKEITFTTKKLGDFFHYEAIEWQSLHKAPQETRQALRKLRKKDREFGRLYEFSRPSEIYIVHKLPCVFKFKIDDAAFEVNIKNVGPLLAWNVAGARAMPFATITFDEPITIEGALARVWEWRRFFVEIAMEPLPFIGISGSGSRRGRFRPASLYLPNLNENEASGLRTGEFYPGAVPLNGWRNRKEFAGVMEAWLRKQNARRVFRSNLEDVINEMHARITLGQILKLSAGVESLKELDRASEYSRAVVRAMAKAAIDAADAKGAEVDGSRVRGALGMLRTQNLGRRLTVLFDAVAPVCPGRDFSPLIKAVVEFRNAGAHGHSGVETLAPKLPATVRGFAAACTLWDQIASRLPESEAKRPFSPRRILFDTLKELEVS